MRNLNITGSGKNSYEHIGEAYRQDLQSFSDGINYYAQNTKILPF